MPPENSATGGLEAAILAVAQAIQPKSGDVVQYQYALYATQATGTAIIPEDDTIPQSSEGTEFMSCTIRPRNANDILVIEVNAMMSMDNANRDVIGALFKNSDTDALTANVGSFNETATGISTISMRHVMVAGTTDSITFKFRAGPNAASGYTFNGQAGGRKFGAIPKSSIHIVEYVN